MVEIRKNIIFLCEKQRKDDQFWGMSRGRSPRDIPRNWSSFLSFPHKNVILFKYCRTRIGILVLETFILLLESFILVLKTFIRLCECFILFLHSFKRITFLCGKLRKDDQFLGMSLGLHPWDIPWNWLSFLCFLHKNIIYYLKTTN